MPELTVPMWGFRPRPYQNHVWNAAVHEKRNVVAVWHRRAGKDLLSMQIAIVRMIDQPGTLIWHVLPTAVQGRKVIWDGRTSEGRAFRDYFPPPLITRTRDDMMQIQMENGSVYQVVGGDQADRLVGANPRLVIFSEYALMNPQAYELVRPILRENRGQAIFISTPRGYNHLYDLFMAGKDAKEGWFVETLDITETAREDGTPIVTAEDVEEEIRLGMPPELAQQEFYVSFNAPLVGSYYGKALEEAERSERIVSLPWRKELPVNTAWDLGVSDATAIIFYQVVGEWVHIMDYYAAHGYGLEHYSKMLQDKPYTYKRHAAPHDIKVRELGTGLSRLDTAYKLGIRFEVAPNLGLEDGISATRMLVGRCKFDKDRCQPLLKALQHYRREFSQRTKTWGSPVHDWSSHPADAFRYLALTVPKRVYEDKKPVFWHRNPTFQDVFDGIVDRKRKERGSALKKWI
jgi:hypothetical protein